ncbi:hypothetical protein COU54_02275 [Candidatus Pacearchaeota archaeon CG10_big_fil_rev_8_21_14_0_10_31_24]|nr:MAG: hypothetical protein COU54_02275 [Candidatus Pacearchaeota archaeon CG10_big_fil_rev_8_21_14_0_10_31_24]
MQSEEGLSYKTDFFSDTLTLSPSFNELKDLEKEEKDSKPPDYIDKYNSNKFIDSMSNHTILTREQEVCHARAMKSSLESYQNIFAIISNSALRISNLVGKLLREPNKRMRITSAFEYPDNVLNNARTQVPEIAELCYANKLILATRKSYDSEVSRLLMNNSKSHQEIILSWRPKIISLEKCVRGDEHVLGVEEMMHQFLEWNRKFKERNIDKVKFDNIYRVFAKETMMIPEEFVNCVQELKKHRAQYYHERDFLIAHNVRLVRSNAAKIFNARRDYTYLTFDDVFSIGLSVGAKKGIEEFDPEKGCKISSYITWWIRASINEAIGNSSRGRRVPMDVTEGICKIKREEARIKAEKGDEISIDELREASGMNVKKFDRLWCARKQGVSFDAEFEGDSDSNYYDVFVDENEVYSSEVAEISDMNEKVKRLLETLDDREKIILRKRFGLNGERSRTLEEIGEEYGFTREYIRQIEGRALKKLRHPERLKSVGLSKKDL